MTRQDKIKEIITDLRKNKCKQCVCEDRGLALCDSMNSSGDCPAENIGDDEIARAIDERIER